MTPNANAVVVPARTTTAKSSRHQAADTSRVPVLAEGVDVVLDPVEAVRRELAAAVAGTWAVVVAVGPGPDGRPRTRRRVFLTATAAQRAVEDARDRGQQAAALLVELLPVGGAL